MKKNLIINVARSFYWSDSDKDMYVNTLKSKYSEYKCTIFFTDTEETTFQVLEDTHKGSEETIRKILSNNTDIVEMKVAFQMLKNLTNKHCENYDYGFSECRKLGIERVNLLAGILALHKEYVLQNLEDKPSFVKTENIK